MVKEIKKEAELDEIFTEAGEKLVVIDFFAVWCGPCKVIGPKLDEIEQEYKEKLVVVKIDVDVQDLEKLVSLYKVEVMPTFIFIRRGAILDSLSGSNEKKLRELVAKHI